MKTPNLPKMKTVYLLEWSEPWPDGMGSDRIHAIYEDYQQAMGSSHNTLQMVFKDDSPEDMERNFRIFDHVREDGVHYCGGVSLKPVPFFPNT